MNNKKTILICIDWFLPGYKAGGPIRSCANLVDHLKDEYNFKIITRDTDYCEKTPYPTVKSNSWLQLEKNVEVYYFSGSELNYSSLKKLITSTPHDFLYVNGIYSFYFSLLPLLFTKSKKIIAARGMLAVSALSIKPLKKKLFITFLRITRLFKNTLFHATSEQEIIDIKKLFPNKIHFAPNLPRKIDTLNFTKAFKENGALAIVNIARISPEKNLLYALQVLKNVKANILFDIYGPIYNKEYWKECENTIRELPSNIKVYKHEPIESTEIINTIKKYHLFFMPTLGENFGHVVAESFAASCPVLISDQTPWRGLEEKKCGWDVSLNDKNRFVQIIEQLSHANEEEYNQLRKSVYDYAVKISDISQLISLNKKLFE